MLASDLNEFKEDREIENGNACKNRQILGENEGVFLSRSVTTIVSRPKKFNCNFHTLFSIMMLSMRQSKFELINASAYK